MNPKSPKRFNDYFLSWYYKNSPGANPFPPWLFAGNILYTIALIFGAVKQWTIEYFLVLGLLYLPILICTISFFIRQRKQEKLLDDFLKNNLFDSLELNNNPILGDLKGSKDKHLSNSQKKKKKKRKFKVIKNCLYKK